MWDSSSPTGDWTPGPLHWECEVLATGPPGKCLYHFLASTYKWYRMISIFLCELSLKFPVEVPHSSYVRLRRVTEVDALQGSTPSRKGVLPKWVLILGCFFFPGGQVQWCDARGGRVLVEKIVIFLGWETRKLKSEKLWLLKRVKESWKEKAKKIKKNLKFGLPSISE